MSNQVNPTTTWYQATPLWYSNKSIVPMDANTREVHIDDSNPANRRLNIQVSDGRISINTAPIYEILEKCPKLERIVIHCADAKGRERPVLIIDTTRGWLSSSQTLKIKQITGSHLDGDNGPMVWETGDTIAMFPRKQPTPVTVQTTAQTTSSRISAFFRSIFSWSSRPPTLTPNRPAIN